MTESSGPIDRILEKYAAAAAAKDAEALMGLYDPNVRVFDTWERWSYEGAESWRTSVRNWFDSLGAEGVRVTFQETQISGVPELAIVSTIVTFTGISAAGQPLRSMQNRLTWAIRPTSSGLRIIHEHSSAPIDFNGMKAILQR